MPDITAPLRGTLVRARGERWIVRTATPGDACTALQLSPLDRARGPKTLLAPFDRVRTLAARRRCRRRSARRVLHQLRALSAGLQPAGTLWAAEHADLQLMPHQLEPPLAIVRHGATRLLVADEVGLGKTVQAGLVIAELAHRIDGLRALLLVPAGLRDQWQEELARRFRIAAVQADAAWLRAVTTDRPIDVNPWSLDGVYLASHDFVKRPEVLRALEDTLWDLVVVDEAHAMGPGTDRRAAADAIARRARRVVLLTATPPWDDGASFGSLARIGSHGAGDSIVLFRRTRHDVLLTPPRRSIVLGVRATAQERRMHERLERYTGRIWRESAGRGDERGKLLAIVLRKRALSGAGSLARSVRRRLELLAGAPPEGARQLSLPLADEDPLADEVPDGTLAAPGLADPRRERRWLLAIAAAAELAAQGESKVARLRRLVARVREPIVIFTEYRDTLDRLARELTRTGRPPLVIHGGMAAADRSRVQRSFNEQDALLLATDAAAEGVNLHARCRVLVHYELPWSGRRLEQRAGRLDRFGQSRRVHEIALVAADTAERLVLAPLAARAAQARLRSRGTVSLLDVLSESRIAEGILAGTPPSLPQATAPRAPAAVVDAERRYGIEAAAEVQRLEQRRRSVTAGAVRLTPDRGDVPVAAIVDGNMAAGTRLCLAYAIEVRNPGGAVIHAEPMVLQLQLTPPAPRVLDRPHLISFVHAIADQPPRAVRQTVDTRVADAVRTARQVDIAVQERLERRAAGMRRICESAARGLVQAGLFDRRAVRDEMKRHAVRDALIDQLDPPVARASDASFAGEAQLIAALLTVGTRTAP